MSALDARAAGVRLSAELSAKSLALAGGTYKKSNASVSIDDVFIVALTQDSILILLRAYPVTWVIYRPVIVGLPNHFLCIIVIEIFEDGTMGGTGRLYVFSEFPLVPSCAFSIAIFMSVISSAALARQVQQESDSAANQIALNGWKRRIDAAIQKKVDSSWKRHSEDLFFASIQYDISDRGEMFNITLIEKSANRRFNTVALQSAQSIRHDKNLLKRPSGLPVATTTALTSRVRTRRLELLPFFDDYKY